MVIQYLAFYIGQCQGSWHHDAVAKMAWRVEGSKKTRQPGQDKNLTGPGRLTNNSYNRGSLAVGFIERSLGEFKSSI